MGIRKRHRSLERNGLRHHELERRVRAGCADGQREVALGSGSQSGGGRPKICCGVVNRGIAIYQGLIIAPVIDGRLQAHDAETGKVVWEARVAFPQDTQTITMAPRIAKGKVIIGVSGGDRPTRGYFDAYDAMTGHRAWRSIRSPAIRRSRSKMRR